MKLSCFGCVHMDVALGVRCVDCEAGELGLMCLSTAQMLPCMCWLAR